MANRKLLHTTIGLVGLASALFTSSTPAADVYKWVEKDGSIHYSDVAPSSVESKRLAKKTSNSVAAPTAAQPGKPSATYADKELEFRKRKVEMEESQKKEQVAQAEAKRKEDYCKGLRGNLRALQEGGRTYRYNEKGERTYLDDTERKQEIARNESDLAQNCK